MQLPAEPWTSSDITALGVRDRLAQFWLAAPSDLLQSLWNGPCGQLTTNLVQQLTTATSFTSEQIALRNAIGEVLQVSFSDPRTPQLLLALFLYSPRELFRIQSADQQLPGWLAEVYQELYETHPATANPISPPASIAVPTQQQEGGAEALPSTLPTPDFGQFPASIEELVNNRIQLNRMLGLSNLYYIDPEDQEILHELLELRYRFAEAIEQCPEHKLETFWSGDLGDRYWAMVRSGVQNEPLAQRDVTKKAMATTRLQPNSGGGFGTPGAVNAFLVAMLYYLPGAMRVDDPSSKLPGWLLPGYQQVFQQALRDAAPS
ncbi:hypothetical protein [Synechococcus sp. MIT S1220]|uniref:hypothetical protein n=1 Tax=Synechococcus sp. MIT S1220 TaxID=3082549 RepID=UPI0039B0A8A3